MSLAYSGVEPQPSLAWQFDTSNVDSVTGLAPSSQVSPGPAQLVGSAALVTNAPTSNTAVYFPGTVNDYMNLGTSTPTNFDASTSNVFFEAWINWTDFGGNRIYGIYSNPSASSSLNLYLRLNGGLLQLSGGTGSTAGNSTTFTAGVWYHIAFSSIPGGSSYVFVNGVPGSGTALTYTAHNATYNTYIGSGASQYLSGYIRDLRVVKGGVVPTTSFTPGSAPFSYTLPSYVTGSGSVVFTLLGQFVTYAPGKYNSALRTLNTPGSTANNYIIYQNNIYDLTQGFTFCFWVNFYNAPSSGSSVPIRFTATSPSYIYCYMNSFKQVFFAAYDSSGVFRGYSDLGGKSENTWYHLTMVCVNGTNYGYINGSLVTSGVCDFTNKLTSGNINLGSSSSGANAFSGLIDDLRIYNTALTAAQVQSVYSSQGAPAPSRAMPLPQYAWDFNGTMNDYVTGLAPSGSNVATLFSSGKYLQSANVYNSSNLVYNNILYYSLTTPLTAPPYTISFWFKLNTNWVTVNANQPVPYFSGIFRAQNAIAFAARGQTASSIGINYSAYDSTNTSRGRSDFNNILDTINWTFACFVVTPYLITIYIRKDGASQLTYTITPSTGATFNQSIGAIGTLYGGSPGAASGTTPPFNGLVDDLRIFNTALTAAQVRSIWAQQGVPGRGGGVTQYIKSATGGDTVQDIGGYRIHTFTTVGTSTFTPATSGLVDVLVVAGGGGGGSATSSIPGGGGGAGEVYYAPNLSLAQGSYTINIGSGGAGSSSGTVRTLNGNSSNIFLGASPIISTNGGGGGGNGSQSGASPQNIYQQPQNGGSGGGCGRYANVNVVQSISITTSPRGLGNPGGFPGGQVNRGSGGGGATSTGGVGVNNGAIGLGGSGFSSSISGNSQSYGTGGNGGNYQTGGAGANGTDNTGNGGAGADGAGTFAGGNGSSGIVIVRYPISGPVNMTGTPLFTQLSTSATSSAVGAFSLRAVNGTSVKAVAVQAHPVVQWPPTAMTSNTTAITGQLYGNGTYVVSDLSGGVVPTVFNMSDNNINTFYEQYYTGVDYYNYNLGTLVDTTKTTTVSGATAAGWWVQMQLPTSIILRSYTLAGRQDNRFWQTRNPTTFWIAGSNDGSNWSNVHYQAGISYGQSGTTISVPQTSNSLAYSYYRLIVNVIGNSGASGNHSTLDIATWNLYGDSPSYAPNAAQDFYADRLGNLLTAPVTGQSLASWLGGATGYVTTWYDQSGRGNNATQATAANQPIITRATKGPGYMCLFNGNQWVSYGTTATFAGTPFSVIAVNRRTVGTNYTSLMGWGNAGATLTGWQTVYFTLDATNDRIFSQVRDGGTTIQTNIPIFTSSSLEPIRYVTLDFNNSFVTRHSVNGSVPVASSAVSGFLNASASGIGSIGSGILNYFTGEIYELLVFTRSLYDIDGTSTITQIYNNQLSAYGT